LGVYGLILVKRLCFRHVHITDFRAAYNRGQIDVYQERIFQGFREFIGFMQNIRWDVYLDVWDIAWSILSLLLILDTYKPTEGIKRIKKQVYFDQQNSHYTTHEVMPLIDINFLLLFDAPSILFGIK
jgi:hypothetical protein